MARISAAETLRALNSPNPPKLVVVGSAQATKGRMSMLMKVRPSTLKRLEPLVLGPQYLLVEHALLKLIEELEARPADAKPIQLLASDFNPTDEDLSEVAAGKALLESNPRPRST